MNPGDLVLVHREGKIEALIRFGERLRFPGAVRTYAYWNHAAIAVSSGSVVEAMYPQGVIRSPMSEYADDKIATVSTGALAGGPAIAKFAMDALGREYGLVQLGTDVLWCLTGISLHWLRDRDALICSELAADALAAGGINVRHRSAICTPADLAEQFRVQEPHA